MPEQNLRNQLGDRIDRLIAQRIEEMDRFNGRLRQIDDQIAASKRLYAQWNTMPIDTALAELKKTGVRLTVE